MRKLVLVGLSLALGMGFSHPASALQEKFEGLLELEFGGMPLIRVPGFGTADVTVTGGDHLDSYRIDANVMHASGTISGLGGGVPIQQIKAQIGHESGTAVLDNTPVGQIPLLGILKACLLAPCAAPPLANLSVPLSVVGKGGIATAMNGNVSVTVKGAPWFIGSVTVATPLGGTGMKHGIRHGPASATSSTANESGLVKLVTPIYVNSNIGNFSGFGYLTVHFLERPVPEPTTAVLAALGLAGLGVGARKRALARRRS